MSSLLSAQCPVPCLSALCPVPSVQCPVSVREGPGGYGGSIPPALLNSLHQKPRIADTVGALVTGGGTTPPAPERMAEEW